MAVITCALDAITDPSSCNDRGGIKSLYWTEYENVDWDTMLTDDTKFDTDNQEILDYTMVSSAVFSKVEFERKAAFYDFTYTRDQDFYQLLVTLQFKGKDRARRNSLQSAINCCAIVLHVYGNAGEQRVIGVDYNGEVFDPILEKLAVTRHLDSGGQLGTSRGRDELDLGGESFYAPLWASVDEADIPLA